MIFALGKNRVQGPLAYIAGQRHRLQILLGHVGPTTLVGHVRNGQKNLEGNYQEQEEAHAGRRLGND